MTRLPRRTRPDRRLRLVSSNEATRSPDLDRNGISITFGGQMAVDLFRHFLGANGAQADASDVARAVAFTISGLEENSSGPLDVLYARSGIPGYPAITVGLAEPPEMPEEPEPPPPRCG